MDSICIDEFHPGVVAAKQWLS